MPFFKRFFARRRLRRDENKAQPQTEQRSVIYYAYEVFTDDPEEPVVAGQAASARSSNLSDLSAPSLLPPPAFDEKIDSRQRETESEEDSSFGESFSPRASQNHKSLSHIAPQHQQSPESLGTQKLWLGTQLQGTLIFFQFTIQLTHNHQTSDQILGNETKYIKKYVRAGS